MCKLFLSLVAVAMLSWRFFAFSENVDVGEVMDQMAHDYQIAMKTNDSGSFKRAWVEMKKSAKEALQGRTSKTGKRSAK